MQNKTRKPADKFGSEQVRTKKSKFTTKKVVLKVSTPEETVNLVISPITTRIHMSRACSCFGRELFQRHKAYMEYTTPQRFHVCSVYW